MIIPNTNQKSLNILNVPPTFLVDWQQSQAFIQTSWIAFSPKHGFNVVDSVGAEVIRWPEEQGLWWRSSTRTQRDSPSTAFSLSHPRKNFFHLEQYIYTITSQTKFEDCSDYIHDGAGFDHHITISSGSPSTKDQRNVSLGSITLSIDLYHGVAVVGRVARDGGDDSTCGGIEREAYEIKIVGGILENKLVARETDRHRHRLKSNR